MLYPIVIHKDPDTSFGVTVPDLPGCFSWGDSYEDACLNAVEAIECHVEGLLIDGDPIPQPRSIEERRDDPDYSDGLWALVNVDLSQLSGKSKRVNVTIPERLLGQVDKFAKANGETRSGLLAAAALMYVANHAGHPSVVGVSKKSKTKKKPGKTRRAKSTV